jgi:hypothetical protein
MELKSVHDVGPHTHFSFTGQLYSLCIFSFWSWNPCVCELFTSMSGLYMSEVVRYIKLKTENIKLYEEIHDHSMCQ